MKRGFQKQSKQIFNPRLKRPRRMKIREMIDWYNWLVSVYVSNFNKMRLYFLLKRWWNHDIDEVHTNLQIW